MKALITGASSGLGYDMAKVMSEMGYDLFLVARRKDRLEELKSSLGTNVTIIPMDLSVKENCFALYEKLKDENIDVLINNAGFGLLGDFCSTDIERELEMIDINIKTVHILTKLFLKDFVERDSGYIMNVASSAGFMAGPLMATYYSTKAYVLNLTNALYEELRHKKSNVHVCSLCPGPVDTEFNKVAGASFGVKSLKSEDVAKYAIKKMFANKLMIIPGLGMKLLLIGTKFAHKKTVLKVTYNLQKNKEIK
jgi:short-subunit dehydrogenase